MENQDVPSQKATHRWTRIAAALLVHAITLMLLSVVLCQLAPGLAQYYQQENIQVPDATSNIIRLSDFCSKFFLLIFCGILTADFALMFMLTSWLRPRSWPLSMYSQLFVLFALMLVVYAASWLANPIIWLAS